MRMRIDYRGGEMARKSLTREQARMRNLRPVLKVYARRLEALIDDSFEEQRDPTGQAWPPLSEETIAERRRRRGGEIVRILIDTTRLRRSWNARARQSDIVFGSDAEYMPAHQFGGGVPRRAQAPVKSVGGRVTWENEGPARQFRRKLNAAIGFFIRTGRVR